MHYVKKKHGQLRARGFGIIKKKKILDGNIANIPNNIRNFVTNIRIKHFFVW